MRSEYSEYPFVPAVPLRGGRSRRDESDEDDDDDRGKKRASNPATPTARKKQRHEQRQSAAVGAHSPGTTPKGKARDAKARPAPASSSSKGVFDEDEPYCHHPHRFERVVTCISTRSRRAVFVIGLFRLATAFRPAVL